MHEMLSDSLRCLLADADRAGVPPVLASVGCLLADAQSRSFFIGIF